MSLPRRALLRMGGGVIASALSSSLAVPAFAHLSGPAVIGVKPTNSRMLSFDCLHTGEKLKADYWVDGQYVPDALAAINRTLRDWRTGEVHTMEPKLLDLLNLLGQKLDSNAGFQVICGYRSPATNAMLHETTSGVASNSQHLLGKAIDIKVPGRDLKKVYDAAIAMAVGGAGYYPKSDFVHVDIGSVRHWVE